MSFSVHREQSDEFRPHVGQTYRKPRLLPIAPLAAPPITTPRLGRFPEASVKQRYRCGNSSGLGFALDGYFNERIDSGRTVAGELLNFNVFCRFFPSKERVLACMGPLANRMAEGATEVWSYNSGDGRTTTVASASTVTDVNGTASHIGNTTNIAGTATGSGFGTAVTKRRSCTVNVTMLNGRVDRVNYLGPTGGLLTTGEQCAYAVQACLQP